MVFPLLQRVSQISLLEDVSNGFYDKKKLVNKPETRTQVLWTTLEASGKDWLRLS